MANFSYVPPTPPKQLMATTGRKINYNPYVEAYYQSLIPSLHSYNAARDSLNLEQQRIGLSQEGLAMSEEAAKQAKKSSMVSLGLAGTSTAFQAYPTVQGWLPSTTPTLTAAGPLAAGAQATAPSGAYAAVGGTPAFTTYGATPAGAAPAAPASMIPSAGSMAGVAAIEGLHQYTRGQTDALARKNIGGEKEWKTGEMMATRAGQGFLIGGPAGAAIGAAEGLVEANSSRIWKEVKKGGGKVWEEVSRPFEQIADWF